MSRQRIAVVVAAAAALLIAGLALRRPSPPPSAWLEPATAKRGDLVHVLREAGALAPRAAVLVKAAMPARLQSVVEDGAWVEQGETLFVLADDEELKKAADERGQLLGARQELRLARLKRANAEAVEAQKLDAARRAAELERLRYRILTSSPVGGDELIRLDAALIPLEADTAAAREAYEKAQDAWQRAFDAHLDALDALQDARDGTLRAQARVDEQAARAEVPPEDLNAVERSEREQAVAELAKAREELAARRADAAALGPKAVAARLARDAAVPPRDAASRELAAREARELELRVRLEIEKRGLPLTKLKLDRESAELALADAQRKRDDGRAAFAAGALSKSALDDLEGAVADKTGDLATLDSRIAVAARPITPEAEAAAKVDLERAEAAAAAAEAARDRALGILDQESAVLAAKEARLASQVAARGRSFAAIIEASIEFAEKELEGVDAEEAEGLADDAGERRAALTAEIARLRADLEAAKADPPNAVRSPVAGIAHVTRQDDRPKQAGDRVYEEDVVVELYPPEDMEVVAALNEVDVERVKAGLRCSVVIPALGDRTVGGVIERVSGIGKDKLADLNGFADVTQFDLRVKLDETGADFRQGMTALVAIDAARREHALWLPRAAVRAEPDGGWSVLAGDQRSPARRAVKGQPFAEDAFVIDDGVAEGETVWIERTRNE